MTLKMCVNCYHGDMHHTIGTTTYCKCRNGQNKHPQKEQAPKYADGIIIPALLDLPCWEPKKD